MIDDLLRPLAPQVLAAVVRRHGDFDAAEDAVQEALLAAATQWPEQGTPDDPAAWLITVANRRLIDALRSESARTRREEKLAAQPPPADVPDADDTVALLLLCCHPSLTPPSQIALTLRAVGGLTTAEIARAFLVPEATMAQRISRAKQRIAATGARFDTPSTLGPMLHVLYLMFTEGHTASAGPDLHRSDLSAEAIRLTRAVRVLRPDDGEVAGLLALMLLTHARRSARTREDGSLVPLAEQDRGRWDRDAVHEGVALISRTLARTALGPYQAQAAIAAVHADAARAEDTDPRSLHGLLDGLAPGPMVTLNRAVAVAMVDGPRAGLTLLETLTEPLADHHRLHAVRAHLLESAGDHDAAHTAYRTAARLTTSLPEQRYLSSRAARLGPTAERR